MGECADPEKGLRTALIDTTAVPCYAVEGGACGFKRRSNPLLGISSIKGWRRLIRPPFLDPVQVSRGPARRIRVGLGPGLKGCISFRSSGTEFPVRNTEFASHVAWIRGLSPVVLLLHGSRT